MLVLLYLIRMGGQHGLLVSELPLPLQRTCCLVNGDNRRKKPRGYSALSVSAAGKTGVKVKSVCRRNNYGVKQSPVVGHVVEKEAGGIAY